MIVQSCPEGHSHFVIQQTDHALLAGEFAKHFGNQRFASIFPLEQMIFAISHHDEGWAEVDCNPPLNPKTDLPYTMSNTPFSILVDVHRRSPDFNEQHHPYAGLIVSMHSWGLYNGRYGLASRIVIKEVPDEHLSAVKQMLDNELERQGQLKMRLLGNPSMARWSEQEWLFRNYKLLQFFDLLALYFNTTHPEAREVEFFPHVPVRLGEKDTTIQITPQGNKVYALDPYPFKKSPLEFSYPGRYISPFSADDSPDMGSVMENSPVEYEHLTLTAD